jgi:hypothetical protein
MWWSEFVTFAGWIIGAAAFGAMVGGSVCYVLGLKDGRIETRLAQSKPARRVAQWPRAAK